MIMSVLMLQRTSKKTKSSGNKETLRRRLQQWENNRINELMHECKDLQNRLPKGKLKMNEEERVKRFTNLVFNGKIKQAVRLLEKDASNGVLPLNLETLQELQMKYPEGKPKYAEMLLQGPIEIVSNVIFDEKTKGSAGPSLYDADDWRNMLGSNLYGAEAEDLRKNLANLAKELCIKEVDDTQSIEALLACRLIPLDKNPGLRLIGETLRRILGKAVMNVMKRDFQHIVGNLELCARHILCSESRDHFGRFPTVCHYANQISECTWREI